MYILLALDSNPRKKQKKVHSKPTIPFPAPLTPLSFPLQRFFSTHVLFLSSPHKRQKRYEILHTLTLRFPSPTLINPYALTHYWSPSFSLSEYTPLSSHSHENPSSLTLPPHKITLPHTHRNQKIAFISSRNPFTS